MGVMDKVLVLRAILVAYTVAAHRVLAVLPHTGGEPSTLTACVFGVCGLENGVMGWIKTNKGQGGRGRQNERERIPPAPENRPRPGPDEPPDVGI